MALPIAGGGLIIAAGMTMGAVTTADDGYALAAVWLTVSGLGMGSCCLRR